MQKISTIFFQYIVVLIGTLALAFLIVEPHFEGRNIDATLFEIYFKDPFLAYVYIASIPFFIALYQAFQLLGNAREKRLSPHFIMNALQIIQYCAVASVGFVFIAVIILMISHDWDDRAPVLVMSVLIAFVWACVLGVARAFGQRIWKMIR